MCAAPSVDRRQHRRHPMAVGVRFHHSQSQRDFPARCVDVSRGGMLMYVPAAAPLKPGHAVRLTVGDDVREEFAYLSEKPIDAAVVRVDREKLLQLGHLAVGVKFAT